MPVYERQRKGERYLSCMFILSCHMLIVLDLAAKLEVTKKRIRKRDRVLLYGKKIVRKVSAVVVEVK